MKASLRSSRTESLEEPSPTFPESDGVAPRSDARDKLDTSEGRTSRPSDLPAELNALRTARTPLIEGVDYRASHPAPIEKKVERAAVDSPPQEKPHVDTLSPLESVPPPAPYLADAPPARPSVVPPVRSPYFEPSTSVRTDQSAGRLGSDPPPRIPISDRPSRPVFRSDFPLRNSRSDPPPSSNRAPTSQRRSWSEDIDDESPEAQRRRAVTIPADARPPSRIPDYDPSVPLPPLRAPTFPAEQLSATIRRHENSRLRNVAMTMMFVICIVTGAIAGMRWYVERADDMPGAGNTTTAVAPRVPKVILDRPPPNAVVTRRLSDQAVAKEEPPVAAEALPTAARDPGPLASTAKPPTTVVPPVVAPPDPVAIKSPWDQPAAGSNPPKTASPALPRVSQKSNATEPGGDVVKTPPPVSTRTPTRPAVRPKDTLPKTPITLD